MLSLILSACGKTSKNIDTKKKNQFLYNLNKVIIQRVLFQK